uniref:C2H2-type domain-containing protein n=2 Tax=Kalanchoe fedtschenkoi TaxID=63787 RepID=A0A7N0V0M7_KALFE
MADVMNAPVEALTQNEDDKPPQKEPEPLPASPTPAFQEPSQKDGERYIQERRNDRHVEPPANRRVRGGDYDDRNRSPPRPYRDRDYKRHASRSPSPPPYRERRRSPSYKRSRREDSGFDGRRGDRRFGYDGGHQRGAGGRYLHADERPYRRDTDLGYLNGLQGWEVAHGRGGYDSNTILKRDGLMSYKQFIQQLEDDILPSEAERRYQEYKSEYISTQKESFFGFHKEEEWLKDKYHPTNLVAVIERRNEHAQKAAEDFLLALRSGSLNFKSAQPGKPNYDDRPDSGRKGKDKDLRSAKETAPKAHSVSSEPRRVLIDIGQAQALIQKLDFEKGILENILIGTANEDSRVSTGPVIIVRGLNFVKGLEGTELLDTLTTYLWNIHGLDYYGMVETSELKGPRHVRSETPVSDPTSIDGAEWEKNLDSHWKKRLGSQDTLELMTAKEKIDAAAGQALDPYVRKIRDEKYGWKFGCGAKGCTKLFHAPEFVLKHLKLKHPELVMELTSRIREDLYFENYMNDPEAPGSKPVMRQTTAERKLGMQNRLKDDRGIHRDYDYQGRGQLYDRSENMEIADGLNGGMDRKDIKEATYEAFGVHDMHAGPAFSSDITPPILMPVPGAGPLGPFIPAPPEVARLMLREQGGAPTFAGGRNGLPMYQGRGSASLLSKAFKQDPRQLRSYTDLDAPEDAVAVIDYRSL